MSEQGQAPPPSEPPKENDPQAARPAPDQATTPLPASAEHTAPAAPGQQPAPGQPEATAAQSADEPAATAAEAPSDPNQPAASPVPPVAAPVRRSRVRGFARHRATQLVAVGLLGLVLGGGIVGAIAANRFDDRGGPGHVRMYERGERGPDRGDRFEERRGGDRFEGRPDGRFEQR